MNTLSYIWVKFICIHFILVDFTIRSIKNVIYCHVYGGTRDENDGV
jgi:hypothetical protein